MPGIRHTPILLGAIAALVVAPSALAATGGVSVGTPGATTTGSGKHSGGATTNAVVPGPRPRASIFHLNPSSITVGDATPRLTVRIIQPASRTVQATVKITQPSGRTVTLSLGKTLTGRTLRFRLPSSMKIVAGTYRLRLAATDHVGQSLATSKTATGTASLRVKAKPKPKPKPKPTPVEVKPRPTSKPTNPSSSVRYRFPVGGPHNFGGAAARFGVGRVGHTHQGQDVLASEGTPVVAPTSGRITYTGYQAAAAGYWVAMHSVDGRDFFFAHCEKGTTTVHSGQSVRPGSHLCRVGQTGDATGPHLHFEIWIHGWRTSSSSHPIDPLPQLKRWQAADPRW